MALPVGIENFAAGLVQGMNQRKADQRQAAQDQRQSDQDAMRKQEFDLQQQARTLDIQNAKDSASRQSQEWDMKLRDHERKKAVETGFGAAMAARNSGDEIGAMTAAASTFNSPSLNLPYKVALRVGPDKQPVRQNGKFVADYMDASGRVVHSQDWAVDDALHGLRGLTDAASLYDKERETESRKADKDAENKAAIERMKIQYDLSDRNAGRQAGRAKDLVDFKEKMDSTLSADGLGLFKDKIVTGKTEDGVPIISTVLNPKKLGDFQAWAKKNSLRPNDGAAQLYFGNTRPGMAPASAPQDDQPQSFEFSVIN